MVHTIQNLKTSNLNPGFEFQQLLVSLKYVINLVMRIRDTGCHTSSAHLSHGAWLHPRICASSGQRGLDLLQQYRVA
jgi:hypothetical protein